MTGTDIVAEAFACLPPGQAAAVAESAEHQAADLEAAGQRAFALVWRAIALSAEQAVNVR